MKTITYKNYYDKVYGGWLGKCLGGAAGAPVEGVKGSIETSMREIMNPDLPNDDLDLQLLWLEVFEKKGPYLTTMDLADAWYKQCWYPFGEYGYFLKNYELGIYPPLSGSRNNRYFYEGMGCPIRSEIWGMVNPGNPLAAAEMAKSDACLDHTGNSLWAEVFLSSLESMAFFESDIVLLIKTALRSVEEDCRFRRCIEMVLSSYEKGIAFREIVRQIQIDYSHPDFTNSVQNLGYTVLALLFGGSDMETTITYALKCGYDADCTCATAGAVIGIINGYEAIPEDVKALLNDRYIVGIDVVRSNDSIATLAADTCKVGLGNNLLSGAIEISEIPNGVAPAVWEKPAEKTEITIEYVEKPSIGFGDACNVFIYVTNITGKDIAGTYSFGNLPEGWEVRPLSGNITAGPGERVRIDAAFSTPPDLALLNQKNIIDFILAENDTAEITKFSFGIAGGLLWNVTGPYIQPREFVTDKSIPPCHGSDSTLPTVETMFSNMAVPGKEYLDEELYVGSPEQFGIERAITAYEDLIPVDGSFGIIGEATFYMYTDLWFDEAAKTWAVIGNNDAYKLWINGSLIDAFDESRVWQPQCHGTIVHFNKGANRVMLKLTRRTSSLNFSFGIRGTDQAHYHSQKWRTDFACMNSIRKT
ncbi:MAG: ADP-ribosylglycohydrolase family protein [Saccharofermentanales bacterium]